MDMDTNTLSKSKRGGNNTNILLKINMYQRRKSLLESELGKLLKWTEKWGIANRLQETTAIGWEQASGEDRKSGWGKVSKLTSKKNHVS
jgi:hypothetical protein